MTTPKGAFGGGGGGSGEKKAGGFWKRMTGSTTSSKPPPTDRSFREFEEEQDDAWGEEINQFEGITFHRKTSMNSVQSKGSRPASTDSTSSRSSSRASSRATSTPPAKAGRTNSGPTALKSPPSGLSMSSSPPKSGGLFAKIKEKRGSSGVGSTRPAGHRRSMSESSVQSSSSLASPGGIGQRVPESPDIDRLRREASAEAARIAKFKALLSSPKLDMEALRELSWSGIPADVRPDTWRLLSGYLPANIERRETALQRKRAEYKDFVAQYYGSRTEEGEKARTYHQIHIDILRTNPKDPSFHNDITYELYERILFIWALRHPASGYVQGINELVTPFVSVFLSAYSGGKVGQCDASVVSQEDRDTVEADAYWCLDKLLDGIQDHYTAAQPGIQKKIASLKDLVSRVDANLHAHLGNSGVDYLTFAFRWMNCMLMREVPLRCTIRLWDTYHAEKDGFASFHLYACLAFLTTFSKELLASPEFQDVIMLLQKPPTQAWTEKDMALLLAEAYSYKFMFHDAKRHFTQSI